MQPGHDASGRRWPGGGEGWFPSGGKVHEADGGLEGLHYASESGRDLLHLPRRSMHGVFPEYSRKLEFMVERGSRDLERTPSFHSLIMNNCDV